MAEFINLWYQLSISEQGDIAIKDATGNNICAMSYSSIYGVMANGESPMLTANKNIAKLRDVGIFQVGDTVEICTKKINDEILHTTTITAIDPVALTITFDPPTPSDFKIPLWASQSPVGIVVRKVTDSINGFTSVAISENTTENGKDLTIVGETPKASVSVTFKCSNSSPKIEIETNATYKDTVKVINESLILTFIDNVSAVFRKNRKTHTQNFADKYWLGSQGVKFGADSRTCFLYNTPNICSLELETLNKKLIVNLDDYRDHRFRRLDQYRVGYSEGMWIDRNAAEFDVLDVRVNSFSLWVGMPINKDIPRLMINPDKYLSTMILDSHADSSPVAQQRAVFYGHQDITNGDNAASGFVGVGLPVTQTFFYGGVDYSLRGTTWETDPDILTDAFNVALDLYQRGFDIGLHSIFFTTGDAPGQTPIPDSRRTQGKNEAMPFMKQHFDSTTWIDHSPQQNALDQCTEGLIPESPSYMKDLWEQYGVRYFWNHSSEDINYSGIDLLCGDNDEWRNPLYWQHPTVTDNFYTRAVQYITAGDQAGWAINYSEDNLQNLINNWGVNIHHNYLCMDGHGTIIKQADGKWVIDPVFESVLQRLKGYKDKGQLNVTTVRKLMDYWIQLENIEFNYNSDGIDVTNNNDETINGLSLTVASPYYAIVIDDSRVVRNPHLGNAIFSFDLAAHETKKIKLEQEQPYVYSEPVKFVNNPW
ncbi:MAG TPA: hypothetical protein DCZ10_16125 [Pelotomaculum sp.]|mgnify:CR=1 FL=1|nr:hypothetical protein [Pelotomaculum sp.]